ncbi:uncharacterized protein SCHCODRAFT_02614120 [Schizophyllum commune H4-8]|uniref:uncharacterized protein n=1 Tax=Schizophyllum commune (strain H4-8 / FGSC 9210) TaxID=578458 RepID=UPI00215EB78C|nr:uncharacterized protein SCHCODRAFT_02614120 [Schizophyllum commune H4-8]KAI5896135.1 hypothetical protein SCHCODRAFT_02614120 [Schizophyllum commune H4-8]
MPHKRAKRSVREKSKKEQGHDLIPAKYSLSEEAIPKSAARVLNAAKVQAEYRAKKRSSEDDGSQGKAKRRKVDSSTSGMSIKPGESLTHFNKRVEDSMRGLVRSAVQTSNAVARNALKKEAEEKKAARQEKKAKRKADDADDDIKDSKSTGGKFNDGKRPAKDDTKTTSTKPPQPSTDKHADRPKEFQQASTSAPRRLNDIAQAPPDLKKLPRGAKKTAGSSAKAGHTPKSDGVVSMAQKVMMEQEREKAIERYRLLRASQRKGWAEGSGEREDSDG